MKTAVQWLEEQINGNELFYIDDLFEQAKEIERQQIIDAHGDKLKNQEVHLILNIGLQEKNITKKHLRNNDSIRHKEKRSNKKKL